MRPSIAAVPFLLLSLASPAAAQMNPDRAGVEQAVLDYVNGFYTGDTTLFLRSVRPDVDKLGFSKDKTGVYQSEPFPWTQFFSFARQVRAGKQQPPAGAAKEVTVLDVQDQTAAAKLRAYWGTDYFLLARYQGRWMIRQIMWQDPPPAKP